MCKGELGTVWDDTSWLSTEQEFRWVQSRSLILEANFANASVHTELSPQPERKEA